MTIDDERVRFYFRHRDQLEEWLALRVDAAAAVDEWLAALKPDVESLAAELGPDVELMPAVERYEAWPGLYLKRKAWPGRQSDDGKFDEDVVAIGMQWGRGKTILGESSAPYVGVRVKSDTRIGRALTADADFQSKRRQRKETPTAFWRAYGYVHPGQPFPEQADEYRGMLMKSLRDAWSADSPAIDRSVLVA
jgi:hypothetical protein